MKFSKAALAVLFVSSQASAWTSRHAVVSRRALLATQLHSTVASYGTSVQGEEATESFRLSFSEDSKSISPWHDIPLKNEDGSYNMVRVCVHAYIRHSYLQTFRVVVVSPLFD
jgi:hypothetical protein